MSKSRKQEISRLHMGNSLPSGTLSGILTQIPALQFSVTTLNQKMSLVVTKVTFKPGPQLTWVPL